MTDKKIIDINECELYFRGERAFTCAGFRICSDDWTPNCPFRQLKRLQAELKEKDKEIQRLKEELQENKKYQYKQDYLQGYIDTLQTQYNAVVEQNRQLQRELKKGEN